MGPIDAEREMEPVKKSKNAGVYIIDSINGDQTPLRHYIFILQYALF